MGKEKKILNLSAVNKKFPVHMLILCLILWFCISLNNQVIAQSDSFEKEKREMLLKDLKILLPESEAWEEWLEESGELPPDFDALESIPYIPDPLKMQNGNKITSADEWPARRDEIIQLFKHYIIGEYPEAPGNLRVREKNTTEEAGAIVHDIIIEFGPGHKATLSFELILPKGDGPFPVFITQDYHRRWALTAVSRGYAGVVYAGADSKDDTEMWKSIYPDYDWTRLTRRAWAAGRVIDYLETLDTIDHDKIALTGHSRNGKVSIIGGAIDDRIDAVVASSSGAAGALSFRSFSEIEFGESAEVISRNFPSWVHPRLRFFVGREDKLPVDAPNLITTIAPRPFLYTHALYDQFESSVWNLEQSYRSSREVYELLNAAENIDLLYRYGTHETRAEDIEQYVDWLDYQFDRGTYSPANEPIYPTADDWRRNASDIPDPDQFPERDLNDLMLQDDGSVISSVTDWESKLNDIKTRITNGLGKPPPEAASHPGSYGAEPQYVAEMLGRADLPDDISKYSLNFGNYINGNLYFPKEVSGDDKLPVVIWLHPTSPARGYKEAYRQGTSAYLSLTKAGFAVLAFDMAGHGSRLNEAVRFHDRYPGWTLLGKMVHDVKQAVNVLLLDPLTDYGRFGDTDFIDREQIYVVGYAMGGKVALHAAALDERISGAVSVAGFTPMRLDDEEKQTGGLARWSEHYPLQPWLAEFIGQEARVPYDYHEVIAAIAPRKVSVITPEIDRHANPDDVTFAVSEAEKVFNLLDAGGNLRLNIPYVYNNLSPRMKELMIEELRSLLDQEAE